jgi:hypothetical protein
MKSEKKQSKTTQANLLNSQANLLNSQLES